MKRVFSFCAAFTLLELLTVMAIIAVLAGMILAGMGYAQQKAARDRASAEISAMSVALESYKGDNGDYPRNTDSDGLNSVTSANPSGYTGASTFLYQSLIGDSDKDGKTDTGAKIYFEFKQGMLSTGTANPSSSTYIIDPFGNSYGYSTDLNKQQSNGAVETPEGYNPTFDLWSTAGGTTPATQVKWITNW